MHIKQINIQNLLSYENTSFSFDEYNVVVGTNNSGKTNLLRILEKISKSNDLEHFGINKNLKFDSNKPAEIGFTLELTHYKTKMILQSILAKEIKQTKFSESVRTLDVKIYWNNILMDEPSPSFLLYHFHSGFTIIGNSGGQNIIFDSNLAFPNDKYENMVNSYKSGNHEKNFINIAKAHRLKHVASLSDNPSFIEAIANGKSLETFLKKTHVLFTQFPLQIQYNINSPTLESNEIVDYLELKKQASHQVSLSSLISKIFMKNFVSVDEIHPGYSQLIQKLIELRDVYFEDYEELRRVFQEITNGIDVRVVKRTPLGEPSTEEHILLEDANRMFSIRDSASGHYALIHVLHLLLNKPDRLIVIDEPEVHFHPIMITRLNEKLRELAIEKNNQLIIISHSPKFVTYNLLDSTKKSKLTMLLRSSQASEAHSSSESFVLNMKSHLFNPEIFFGKCSMIVEGSGDYFAMKAISDYFDGLFEKYNITLTYCWGKGNVPAFIQLHQEFKIPYVVMVDSDYTGNMTNVIKLPTDLEGEYKNLGWAGSKVKDDAYPFMEQLLQSGDLSTLHQSTMWTAFAEVINKSGGKIPKKAVEQNSS